ncbi:MAG: carbon-nitrogen hydrolase [Deltaproteobacteria bacterium]|nr:carbon-nitrogen hydrolase [Deltaproteobacteria bacterium]
MKIGFIQFQPYLCDLSKTIETLDRLLDRAVSADLIVLPELCNSGYNFDSFSTAFKTSEEITNSRFIDFLISRASPNNQFIVSGFNERDGDLLYNSAVLIGPWGYLGKYRKLHLFMNEKDYFQPGNSGLPVFDVGECKIGMLVCFDWIFPETWRVLAIKGADIICHPSNLVLPGLAQRAIPVQSLMNRVYIITANRTGREGDLEFTGLSTIANPKGEVLLQASGTDEEVGIVEINIDTARDKNITRRNNIFSDRRPGEYSLLVKSGKTF